MKRIFAAWLTICSKASAEKSENWNSKTGRQPASAAPTATPGSAELGDRRVHHAVPRHSGAPDRRSPGRRRHRRRYPRPSGTRGDRRPWLAQGPPGSPGNRSARGQWGRSCGIDVSGDFAGDGIGAVAGELDPVGDFSLSAGADRGGFAFVEDLPRDQCQLEMPDRVLGLPFLDFFLSAIAVAVALGMAADAVGLAFDQARAFARRGRAPSLPSPLR